MAGIAAGGDVRNAIVDRVAEAILREAEAFEADLIVLGRPRRGELATRLLGSVTMRVLRRSSCPVIVAPRQPPPPASRIRPGPGTRPDLTSPTNPSHHVSPIPKSVVVALYRTYPLESHIHRLVGRDWRTVGHSGFTDH